MPDDTPKPPDLLTTLQNRLVEIEAKLTALEARRDELPEAARKDLDAKIAGLGGEIEALKKRKEAASAKSNGECFMFGFQSALNPWRESENE